MRKLIFLLVVVALTISSGCGLRPSDSALPVKPELSIWGVFDRTEQWQPILAAYPDTDIAYRKWLFEEYEGVLLSELQKGGGPDLLMIHANWLERYRDFLAPVEVDLTNFLPETSRWQGIGLPLGLDNLNLAVNPALLKVSAVPSSWQGMLDLAKTHSGYLLAVGDFGNVDRPQDLRSIIPTDIYRQLAQVAWSAAAPDFIEAFNRGQVAIVPAYQYTASRLTGSWQGVSLPENKTVFNYYVLAINKNSQHIKEAQRFLQFLSGREQMLKYCQQTGQPSPRTDIGRQDCGVEDKYEVFWENRGKR